MSGDAARRRLLLAGVGAGAGPVLPARARAPRRVEGGFVGVDHERGHRFRDATSGAARDVAGRSGDERTPASPGPIEERRCEVLVVGAGIAGLAAARAVARAGVRDCRIVELEDEAGGNSRAGSIGGFACPRGAHYLPVPGAQAREVLEFLAETGARLPAGGWDERMLVHAPQERLLMHGIWQEGLAPRVAVPSSELAEFGRFARLVGNARATGRYAIPLDTARVDASLDAIRFAAWLDAAGLHSPALRTYLDYCCRDDFGAGVAHVSAWAGLHYFASRHGVPVDGGAGGESILTWPQGNGWLVERIARALAHPVEAGVIVTRVAPQASGVRVDAVRGVDGRRLRWWAAQVVLAVPAFVAARMLDVPGDARARVARAAARLAYAPWVVANLVVDEAVADAPGAAPAWDNVIHGSASLGYVDARHQRLDRRREPRVWTWYHAPGPRAGSWERARRELLATRWEDWVARVVTDLAPAHRDIGTRLRRVDVVRYGHAMSVPTPGLYGSGALEVLREPIGRVRLAHADLAGYSVFEEAFTWGTRVGRDVAALVLGVRAAPASPRGAPTSASGVG